MDMFERAKKKLEKESVGKFDKQGEVMKDAVKAALLDFARQEEEFAQAIVQGGSFAACMQAVAKNCGNALSDLEAYSRAVSFYFPGAQIKFRMEIDLIGDAAKEADEAEGQNGLILDLSAFL